MQGCSCRSRDEAAGRRSRRAPPPTRAFLQQNTTTLKGCQDIGLQRWTMLATNEPQLTSGRGRSERWIIAVTGLAQARAYRTELYLGSGASAWARGCGRASSPPPRRSSSTRACCGGASSGRCSWRCWWMPGTGKPGGSLGFRPWMGGAGCPGGGHCQALGAAGKCPWRESPAAVPECAGVALVKLERVVSPTSSANGVVEGP